MSNEVYGVKFGDTDWHKEMADKLRELVSNRRSYASDSNGFVIKQREELTNIERVHRDESIS